MIVLDSDAAISVVLGTDEGLALQAFALEGEKVLAPALFHAEFSHALEKYVRGDRFLIDVALELYQKGVALIDEFVTEESLALEALHEAARLKHSSYDMFYFVLARRLGATLFTLDKKLMHLCEENGVECIHRVTLE